MDKHVATGFHATPCELARKVFNVAALLAIRGEKCSCPQAELGIGLQPALFLLTAGMSGVLNPAARQRVEARCTGIDQLRLTYHRRPPSWLLSHSSLLLSAGIQNVSSAGAAAPDVKSTRPARPRRKAHCVGGHQSETVRIWRMLGFGRRHGRRIWKRQSPKSHKRLGVSSRTALGVMWFQEHHSSIPPSAAWLLISGKLHRMSTLLPHSKGRRRMTIDEDVPTIQGGHEHRECSADPALAFLHGGGAMGALVRQKDWTETAVGATESWPQSLRSAVSICLGSGFPIGRSTGDRSLSFCTMTRGSRFRARSTLGPLANPPAEYGRKSGIPSDRFSNT
jgi:hypothetical protein